MSEIVSSENKYSDHKKSYYSLSYSFSDDPDDTYTIVDIIREKEFYNLLFQLNADIIKEYNVVNKEDNYKENVLVTIDIGNDDPDGGEILDEGEEMKLKMVKIEVIFTFIFIKNHILYLTELTIMIFYM